MSNQLWIDLNERKPTCEVEVIICTDFGLVTTDTYSDHGYAEGFNNYNGFVTHWMPMPEAFKEGDS